MLSAVVWLSLLGSPAAPTLVAPGMTVEQVEAILGRPDVIVFSGSVNSGNAMPRDYIGWGISVCFEGNKVSSVSRRMK
jgi:hypothetical protein